MLHCPNANQFKARIRCCVHRARTFRWRSRRRLFGDNVEEVPVHRPQRGGGQGHRSDLRESAGSEASRSGERLNLINRDKSVPAPIELSVAPTSSWQLIGKGKTSPEIDALKGIPASSVRSSEHWDCPQASPDAEGAPVKIPGLLSRPASRPQETVGVQGLRSDEEEGSKEAGRPSSGGASLFTSSLPWSRCWHCRQLLSSSSASRAFLGRHLLTLGPRWSEALALLQL